MWYCIFVEKHNIYLLTNVNGIYYKVIRNYTWENWLCERKQLHIHSKGV